MIRKVSTPLEEQETDIIILPNQVEERVSIYTSSSNMLTKLWKLHEQRPDELLVVKDDKYGTEFSAPRTWIKVKPPKQYSEEQKEKMRAVLAANKK